ncbi:MAG: hypothetical protein G8345_00525 [Magnetococcales bacterium]|nr:hypothetical protein [Magnetococcales bacterium]NGZ25352.1 hypothetical protein [Magnetococcales bacterium]
MPVTLLLCEGVPNGPDIVLLGKLLAGKCEIKAMGGKYGMGDRVMARQEVLGEGSVAGLLDRDFINPWQPPQYIPKPWTISGGHHRLGWYWERKEIENYLLDPLLIEKLFNGIIDMDEYIKILNHARDTIANYQAARIALSANRLRFSPLPSSFGSKRGSDKHLFPDALDINSCQAGIEQTIQAYDGSQTISLEQVLKTFTEVLPECQPGGGRYDNFLCGFAGKDLLWAMDGWIKSKGWQGAFALREKIVKSIRQSSDDISQWLPELAALKQMILS